MYKVLGGPKFDFFLLATIGFLVLTSVLILKSLAPSFFPLYYFYLVLALVSFFIFSQIDFEVYSLFSRLLYLTSLFFLILPLIIGEVTRGAVRWIPIGPLTIQPAEIVRPFLLLFFANFLAKGKLNLIKIVKAILLASIPLFLILIQPSLGVAFLTVVGFLGVLFASNFNKRYLLLLVLVFLIFLPVGWRILAPYQKARIVTFLDPARDRLGLGYNSIQAMIAAGSGKMLGRGLGHGVQTQLAFLPEKHTDFIFASIGEEFGFLGTSFLLLGTFILFWRLISILGEAKSVVERAYVSGLFLTLFVQVFVHVGMNLGLLPITGIPYPLVSAGGSSLLATLAGLGIAQAAKAR